MSLTKLHHDFGAHLAADGIPLHYGDLLAEYRAGIEGVILLDRSHEGRVDVEGDDRLAFVHRMSTNDVERLSDGAGCGTVFLNPTGRIIDRVVAYAQEARLRLITAPARGAAVERYLQRNIFFGDKVRLVNQTANTKQFALHGVLAGEVMGEFFDVGAVDEHHWVAVEADGLRFTALRRRALSGQHWAIIVEDSQAEAVYQLLYARGKAHGLELAGSLTYNTLRIRAGIPAMVELSAEYIPLEVGLWNEVSFKKGCYTGQEIIARMESRERLAKTLVRIDMETYCEAPADLLVGGRVVGTLTSSVQAPGGALFGMGVIKTDFIAKGTALVLGETGIPALVAGLLGAQPHFLR